MQQQQDQWVLTLEFLYRRLTLARDLLAEAMASAGHNVPRVILSPLCR